MEKEKPTQDFFETLELTRQKRSEIYALERYLTKQVFELRPIIWGWRDKDNQSIRCGRKMYKVLRWRLVEKLTLEEVGKKMGVTRERVRQLEEKALEIIKNYNLPHQPPNIKQ